MLDLAERRRPDVVCISATPPAAVMHARRLCKRVRGQFADVPMVVGLWNAQGDLSNATARIGGGDATRGRGDVGGGAGTGPPANPAALAAIGAGSAAGGRTRDFGGRRTSETTRFVCHSSLRRTNMLGTILIVLLILMLLGALPAWGYSRSWGYGPSSGLGLIALVLVILLLMGRI